MLIEFIRQLRYERLSVAKAVKKGCEQRFRSVMMTTEGVVLNLNQTRRPHMKTLKRLLLTASMCCLVATANADNNSPQNFNNSSANYNVPNATYDSQGNRTGY